MRLLGAALGIVSLLVITGYVSYELAVSREVSLVLKIAVPVGAVGALLVLVSVLREQQKAHRGEGLDEVEP